MYVWPSRPMFDAHTCFVKAGPGCGGEPEASGETGSRQETRAPGRGGQRFQSGALRRQLQHKARSETRSRSWNHSCQGYPHHIKGKPKAQESQLMIPRLILVGRYGHCSEPFQQKVQLEGTVGKEFFDTWREPLPVGVC